MGLVGFGKLIIPPLVNYEVHRVTNLNDSGAGSLRAALEASGPRIIVVEQSGECHLESDIEIKSGLVRFAGQTADGGGLVLRGATVRVLASNVLLEHLTVIPGDDPNGPNPNTRDGFGIVATGGAHLENIYLRNCSVFYAIDEAVGFYQEQGSSISNVTLEECVFAWTLRHSLQGDHSMGVLVGNGVKNLTIFRCIIAHCYDRNPQLQGIEGFEFLNNLIYNCGPKPWNRFNVNNAAKITARFEGNEYRPGPDSRLPDHQQKMLSADNGPLGAGSLVYYNDNAIVPDDLSSWADCVDFSEVFRAQNRPFTSGLEPYEREDNSKFVRKNAGARRPGNQLLTALRMQIDSVSGEIIDKPSDGFGYPPIDQVYRALDVPMIGVHAWLDQFGADGSLPDDVVEPPPDPDPGPDPHPDETSILMTVPGDIEEVEIVDTNTARIKYVAY